jgi:hypothetical protein
MTEEKMVKIGGLKSLVSYFDDVTHTWYLERQETKGVLFPIYKNEIHHVSRVAERIKQSKKTWKRVSPKIAEMNTKSDESKSGGDKNG